MKHSMLVATELTTEDMLDIFIELARKLACKLTDETREKQSWQNEFNMYRDAWLRELGNKLISKSHEIDALVLTTKQMYADAQRWRAFDCFWDALDLKIVDETPEIPKT